MTPAQARAAFLWGLTSPEQVLAAANTPALKRALAELRGVSVKTIERDRLRFWPCPGPRCMTHVRGGGLCSWCRRAP